MSMKLTARQGRIQSLDGLRGVAAFVVVLHHALITYPILRNVFEDGPPIAKTGSPAWWMVQTPLHFFWAGGEAVFVFFILSGVVLGLLVRRSEAFDWRSYYPSRLVRLYLPVWSSIVFALLIFIAVRAVSPAAGVRWFDERRTDFAPVDLLKAAVFLRGTDKYNGPLWSLLWEILFSLLLPAFVVVYIRFRRSWPTQLIVTFFVMAIGCVLRSEVAPVGNFLLYMSIFGVGMIMAAHLDEFRALSERLDATPHDRRWWALLLLAGCLALCAYWYVQPARLPIQMMHLTYLVQVAGAAMIVFCVAFDPRVVRAFTARPVRALGRISFSLYLVHDPVLLAINHLTGDNSQPLVLLVGVPLSVVVAIGFYQFAEKPSHKLAKRLSARLSRPAKRSPEPVPMRTTSS